MANNCYNEIIIDGNPKELESLYKILQEKKEEEIYKHLLNIFKPNKKPNCFEMNIEISEVGTIISGDSTWSPPIELFSKIGEMFKQINIYMKYQEKNSDIAGYVIIENGETSMEELNYWEFQIKELGEEEALNMVIDNELHRYDSSESLLLSGMYKSFNTESKKTILDNYELLIP